MPFGILWLIVVAGVKSVLADKRQLSTVRFMMDVTVTDSLHSFATHE